MGRMRFEELSKVRYKQNRNLVVSRAYDREGNPRGYAISRQLVENEGQENETRVFLKEGLGIVDADALVAMADMFAQICHDEGLLTIADVPEEGDEEPELFDHELDTDENPWVETPDEDW